MRHLGTLLTLLMLAMSIIFYDQVARAVTLAAFALAGLVTIAGAGFIAATGWFAVEKMRFYRAKRIEAEKQAHVMTLTDNGQVWVRDTDRRAIWRALHLEQRVFSTTTFEQPSEIEARAWHLFNLPSRAGKPPQLLEPPAAPVDLLAALDNVARCLIVGASDTGKTTLLQHIITRRAQSSTVVVIDPHAWPDKWPGCKVLGTGRNYAEIDRALSALVEIMSKRYDEIGKGLVQEGRHPRLTILIDEWRAIVGNVKSASEAIKALLTESRKAAFSVFVATHSDRAKPLGLEGEYDLKDGFAIVRLSIENDQRKATLDTGTGERLAQLPGPFYGQPVLESDEFINLEVEPTPAEAAILNLHERGESYNEIARQVWGSSGGYQVNKIKEVLSKFNSV